MEMVSWLGCDELQGYYISAPLKARDFADWLDSGGAVALARRRAAAIAVELEASKIDLNPGLGDEPDLDAGDGRKRSVS
jgi:hypothetical protein